MSSPAFGALYTANPEAERPRGQLYGSLIVTVDRKTGGTGAGTGQLMKLDMINNRIIKGLRNLVAIWDKNGYHSIVNQCH